MPWMLYQAWTGPVNGARVRVPTTFLHASAFGPSANELRLRPGAVGTVVNILPKSAKPPHYVKYPRPLNLDFAAEVLFRKSDNSGVMWKDFYVLAMKSDEAYVVLSRSKMDKLEIEYGARP